MAEKKIALKSTRKAAATPKKVPVVKEVAKPKQLGKLERIIFDMTGKEVGMIALPKSIFGGKINTSLLSQAIRVYQANQHQGTSSTKTRGEIRGGGRKPWKQKGTGNARQGSIRAPHWRGGGVTFGPRPRDLSLDLPSKMKQAALRAALASRLEDLVVVESFKLKDHKTKLVSIALKKLNLSGKTLFVLPQEAPEVVQAGRNIKKLELVAFKNLNALQVVSAGKVVLARETVESLGKDKNES